MKKILLLGGSAQQVVAIEKAKELGYYTILCDFLPDNPGQNTANKFYLISTTDKEAVLKLAQDEAIDGVLAYASDPAAPTAAYVAEKMGLPGNPYKSAEILCNKDLFREFLASNGFCTPKAYAYSELEEALQSLRTGCFKFPVIIKPVDSSGSKGVIQCQDIEDARDKLIYAMSFSKRKRIIIEEFVEKYGYQIAGDGMSIDGKLVFRCFGNDHFNQKCVNPFVPIAASFPYNMSDKVQDKIHHEIQRLLDLLEMKNCTYNFDIRVDQDYNIYLMEIAPRDGGNYIPQVIQYATGIDLIEYSIKFAMGEEVSPPESKKIKGYWAYYAVHSLKDGILKDIYINPKVVREYIIDNYLHKQPGDSISAFTGANTTLGCFLMQFESMDEMLQMLDHSEQWITVILEEET